MKTKTTLKTSSTEVLKCRSLGHAWDPIATFLEKEGRKEFLRMELECLRCTVTRTDEIARRTGELDRRTYGYVDGYLLADPKTYGSRSMLNNTTRAELYERIFSTGTEVGLHAVS